MVDRVVHTVPPGFLLAAGALVVIVMTGIGVARWMGVEFTGAPLPPPIESRELRFEDRADGAVVVSDARDRRIIEVLPAREGKGFVRVAMRGLARERKRLGIGAEPPFRLNRWADGRLSLDDPETGRAVHLNAFGAANADAFAGLLAKEQAATP